MTASSWLQIPAVLFEPTKTFEAICRRPTWLPAMGVLVISAALAAVLVVQHADLSGSLRQSALLSGKDVDSRLAESAAMETGYPWIAAAVAVVLMGPITYALTALAFWVAFKIVGGELDYRRALAITTHGLIPWCVQGLTATVVVLARGHVSDEQIQRGTLVMSNLAAFAHDETGHGVLSLLGGLDLFSLWSVVLLGIGFAVAARVSRATSAGLVVALWICYLACKAGLAAAFS